MGIDIVVGDKFVIIDIFISLFKYCDKVLVNVGWGENWVIDICFYVFSKVLNFILLRFG